MPRKVEVAALSPLVRSRRDLIDHGSSERMIESRVRAGELRLVRRGWYIERQEWSALWPEGRHLAHTLAVVRDSAGGAVVSHESAAVLWDLPLYRMAVPRVHVTMLRQGRISSGPDVMRHVAPLPSGDVVVRHGIRCTSLERTVFDAVRTLDAEAAISIADAAERQMALRGREWDEDAVVAWRRKMGERLDAASGVRGIRQARRLVAFADGQAQLPGESVSRLQLVRIGFAVPRLQVPFPAPHGGKYWIDFGLDDVRTWGEFDGKDKYLDEAMRRGLTVEQVLLEEKMREDWIRGRSQWRFVRWGSEHSRTPASLAKRLASFGVRPPGR